MNRTVGLHFCKNSHTARDSNSNKSVQFVNNKIKSLCQVLFDALFVNMESTSWLRIVSIS